MEVVKDSTENCENKAVEIITDRIRSKEKVLFAIPGGRSPQGIFKKLKTADIDWKKVHIFMVDERFVPLDDKESNFRGAKEAFIDELVKKGALPEENVHPFKGDVKAYEQEFLQQGDKFDIVLLGVGEDGHTASLFPNHPSIKDESEHFIIVENSPKLPPKRMSSSKKLIAKSDTAILLIFGEEKQPSFDMLNDEKLGVIGCPCKIVKDVKDSFVFNDNL